MSQTIGFFVALVIDNSFNLKILFCSYVACAIMGSESETPSNFLNKTSMGHCLHLSNLHITLLGEGIMLYKD